MNIRTPTRAAALALAVTLGAAGPTLAAPVLTMTSAVKEAAPSEATAVRYYRDRHYRNNGGAVALGILGAVGAVAAASAYNHGPYHRQGYYYGDGPQYGYGPAYYGHPHYYGNHRSW